MNPKLQTALGIGATALLVAITEPIRIGGLLMFIAVILLAISSLIAGERLPLFVRVLATGTIYYHAFVMLLIGRTTEPHLSADTITMAIFYFGLFALLPVLALFRVWRKRIAVALAAVVLPVALIAACTVAAYEEKAFVRQHAEGIGPTGRWTVSHHWLAYNAETQELYGND